MKAFPPKFFYFDLGNVLLKFSHEVMCRQLAHLFEADPARVHQLLLEGDDCLQAQLESGRIDGATYYEQACASFPTRPEREPFDEAAGRIFQVNPSMLPVLGQLSAAGYRLGLLSNINEIHWDWIQRRNYSLIPAAFSVCALSYELRVMKPHADIYHKAAQLCETAPHDIFFVDDVPENVAGARLAGWDAVLYTTTPALVVELRRRGVEFNY